MDMYCEVRWNDVGEIGLKFGKIILYLVYIEEYVIIYFRRGIK